MNKLRNLAIGVTALSVVGSLGAAVAWGTLNAGDEPVEAIPVQSLQVSEVVESGAAQFGQEATLDAGSLGGTATPVRGRTVGEALKSAGITPGAADIVSAPLDTKLVAGQKITYVKVTSKEVTKKKTIAFDKKTEETSSLPKGEQKVTTEGVNGEAVETYRQVFHDGTLVTTELVSSDVTKMPVTEVTEVGTGSTSEPSSSSSGNSSSSSSSSRSNSASSRSSSRSETPVTNGQTCKASYYDTGSRTANGESFNPDGITAAHRTLPFGTMVKVTNVANGRTVTVRINDRGPFIGDRCLDLSRGAMREVGGISSGVITLRMQVL